MKNRTTSSLRLLFREILLVLAAYVAVSAVFFWWQDAFIFPVPSAGSHENLRSMTEVDFEHQTLTTSDGLTLSFWAAAPKAGQPMIIDFHSNHTLATWTAPYLSALVAHGYGVVLAEYRGYGGNPGKPSEAGLDRDAEAYLDWTLRHDNGELPILIGESVGTGVAIDLALRHQVRGIILDSAFTSIAAIIRSGPIVWLPTFCIRASTRS